MSKFFPGCRAKKVRGKNNIGREVRVVAVGHFTHDGLGRSFNGATFDMQVIGESSWTNSYGARMPAGDITYTDQEFYEPIAPEGAAPSEFKTLHELLDSIELTTTSP